VRKRASPSEPGKHFLRRVYQEWRYRLAAVVPDGPSAVLELGAGDPWMPRVLEGAIRSDLQPLADIDLAADACALPLRDGALKAIVMTDVFHHLPNAGLFLDEASRALRTGGVVAMIEPWRTAWSEWIYTRFHHEPFDARRAEWRFPPGDPMEAANGALPWIVFERDRAHFERQWPALQLERVEPFMPFRYLLSGGLTFPSLQPGWMFPFWTAAERLLGPRMAMFAFIVLRRA
jgi:SAM-dependent methyltransferase